MADMTRVTVTPPVANLAFSILVPGDFHQVPLPEESQDFSNPTAMMPCGVFMAGYGAVLCTVAARPAFDDGCVMDWATYLVGQQEGFTVKKLMPERRWGTQVVEVEATQPSEAGEMTVHAIFFEDGGRLINIGRMAPTAIWPSVKDTLAAMIDSFALHHVEGPTRPLSNGLPLPPKAQFAPLVEVPAQAAAPAAVPAATPKPSDPETSAPGRAGSGLPDLSAYALDDAGALDPNDDINARFRDAGAGLVPHMLHRDPAKKCALVGAGAIEALLPVPDGWHVVDDGRRTLLFDRGNKIQVNLNLFTIDNETPSTIFTTIVEGLSKEHPDVEHRAFTVDGMNAMQVRGLVIDGEAIQQAYLLKRLAENVALKIRITANEENLPRAADMTSELLRALQPMHVVEPVPQPQQQ
jgi:hypothetical protein